MPSGARHATLCWTFHYSAKNASGAAVVIEVPPMKLA
jgi:hypothetical protein